MVCPRFSFFLIFVQIQFALDHQGIMVRFVTKSTMYSVSDCRSASTSEKQTLRLKGGHEVQQPWPFSIILMHEFHHMSV